MGFDLNVQSGSIQGTPSTWKDPYICSIGIDSCTNDDSKKDLPDTIILCSFSAIHPAAKPCDDPRTDCFDHPDCALALHVHMIHI